jgi:hypothetical protein
MFFDVSLMLLDVFLSCLMFVSCFNDKFHCLNIIKKETRRERQLLNFFAQYFHQNIERYQFFKYNLN